MKLLDLYIENFGKLSDFKLSFTDGLNTVTEDNGYGKTTLTVFIKAMLYGLDDTKRVKLEVNDRKHYMPWQGGRCGGYLTFSHKGKAYRIERTFMPKAGDDVYKIYDVKSGKETRDFGEIPGEELFGIDADGFERTVFLSEANLSGKNENKTISAKLSDLVGTDGDIGVMDEAIELLEKQRKFYYKKGGAGEIGTVKRKISEIDLAIGDLYKIKEEMAEYEAHLGSVERELGELYTQKRKGEEVSKRAAEQRLKYTYLKHYAQMKESLRAEEESKRALEGFFLRKIPTDEDIQHAKYIDSRYRSYKLSEVSSESTDRSPVSEMFGDSFSDEEFLRIKKLSTEVEAKSAALAVLKEKRSSSTDAESYFIKDGISISEAEGHIEALSKAGSLKKVKKLFAPLMLLGVIILCAGIGIGYIMNPVFYAISALGAALLIPAFNNLSACKKAKKQRIIYENARKYILDSTFLTEATEDTMTEKLYEIKAQIEKRNKNRENNIELDSRIDALTAEIDSANREACEFISKFPLESKGSIRDAIYEIERKRVMHGVFTEKRKESIEKNRAREEEKLSLSRELSEFISGFRVTTENPIDEISKKIIEYTSLSKSVERMKATLKSYAEEHGFDPDINLSNIEELNVNEESSESLLPRISELEKSKAILERQYRNAEDEVNKLGDLQAERDALIEKEESYKHNLDIILKTMDFLSEAKDSLTSKYLSKTKTAFDKYISFVSEEKAPDFKIDTSFYVMKSEKGSYKASEAYSKGTKDTIALAMRLALVDSLYDNEAPFIILDDPFVHFDDKKIKAASSLVRALSKEKQVIYFTCSRSRAI